jgi:hypothetical protein
MRASPGVPACACLGNVVFFVVTKPDLVVDCLRLRGSMGRQRQQVVFSRLG